MVEWEWPQEESVDDAEDDDVCADAEGKDEDGDSGEGAILVEGAEGVAQILRKSFDHGEAPGVTMNFFGLLRAAELRVSAAAGFLRGQSGFEIFLNG
jgi:hypothetical protein